MKNLLNLMRFDLISATCSAGNKQTAAYILIALVFLILAFFGMPLMMLLLFVGVLMLTAPLQGIAEKNNFNKLYGILPVPFRQVVQARFLLIFLSLFLCEIVIFLISSLSELLHVYRFDTSDFVIGIPQLLMFCVGIFAFFVSAMSYSQMMLWIYGQENEMKVMVYTMAGLFLTGGLIFLLMYLHILPSPVQLYQMLPETTGGKLVLYAVLHVLTAGICAACCQHTVKKLAAREL